MVIYDGETGQGCHVIFCLMESVYVWWEVDGVRTCVHTRERKRINSGTGVFFWNLSDQVNCMENTVPGLKLQ